MPLDLRALGDVPTRVGGYSPLKALQQADVAVENQRKQREAQAEAQRQQMIDQVVQQHPDDPDAAIAFLRPRDWRAAASLEKQITEQRTKVIEMRGKELENLFKAGQISEQQVKLEHDALVNKNWKAWAELYALDPEGAAEKGRFVLGPEKWAQIETAARNATTAERNAATNEAQETRLAQPPPPQPFTLGQGQTRFGPDGKPIASVAPRPVVATGGAAGAPSALVQSIIKNPSLFKTLTPTMKERLIVPLTQAGFDFATQAEGPSGKPSTGLEKRALNFFQRAEKAVKELDDIGPISGRENAWNQTAGELPLVGNAMKTTRGQQYTQAQRAFTEARLRKDSGAAIPPQEFENDRLTYFRQVGDSPEVIAQKERARNNILASLAFESGNAFHEFYGDDAPTMLNTFKGKSVKPGAGGGTYTGEVRQTPDGRHIGLINGKPVELVQSGSGWVPK